MLVALVLDHKARQRPDDKPDSSLAVWSDTTKDLLDSVLDAYREEYKETADTWHRIDAKAQSSAAIAGVFLAASLTFLRGDGVLAQIAPHMRNVLSAVVALLTLSVIVALMGQRMRHAAGPPSAERTANETDNLLEAIGADGQEALMHDFYRDQFNGWQRSTLALRRQVAGKGTLVLVAQIASGLAAIGVAIVVVSVIQGAPYGEDVHKPEQGRDPVLEPRTPEEQLLQDSRPREQCETTATHCTLDKRWQIHAQDSPRRQDDAAGRSRQGKKDGDQGQVERH